MRTWEFSCFVEYFLSVKHTSAHTKTLNDLVYKLCKLRKKPFVWEEGALKRELFKRLEWRIR